MPEESHSFIMTEQNGKKLFVVCHKHSCRLRPGSIQTVQLHESDRGSVLVLCCLCSP